MSTSLNQSKHLTAAELQHLLSLLLPDSSRDAIYLQLLVETGCRPSEALAVKLSHLFNGCRSVLLVGLKGSKSREMPLSANLAVKLSKHISQFEASAAGVDAKLFVFGYHTARRIWLYYRPVKKSLRATRHSFAIDLYGASKDIQLVKSCLGHVSINSTMVYAEYSYSINERAKALASGAVGWRDYGSKKSKKAV